MFFFDKLSEIVENKANSFEKEDIVKQIVPKLLKISQNMIIGINELVIGDDISFGATSVVY